MPSRYNWICSENNSGWQSCLVWSCVAENFSLFSEAAIIAWTKEVEKEPMPIGKSRDYHVTKILPFFSFCSLESLSLLPAPPLPPPLFHISFFRLVVQFFIVTLNFSECLTRKTTIVGATTWAICSTTQARNCLYNGPTNTRAQTPTTTAKSSSSTCVERRSEMAQPLGE